MNVKFSRLFIILFLILGTLGVFAQPGPPPPDPGDPVPLTGIEILIGIGAFLGIKRIVTRPKPNR